MLDGSAFPLECACDRVAMLIRGFLARELGNPMPVGATLGRILSVATTPASPTLRTRTPTRGFGKTAVTADDDRAPRNDRTQYGFILPTRPAQGALA